MTEKVMQGVTGSSRHNELISRTGPKHVRKSTPSHLQASPTTTHKSQCDVHVILFPQPQNQTIEMLISPHILRKSTHALRCRFKDGTLHPRLNIVCAHDTARLVYVCLKTMQTLS